MVVEKMNIKNLWYDNFISVFLNNMMDLGILGVFCYGLSFLKFLLDVDFNGLVGKFKFVNMEFELLIFDIINFIGKEERIVGFWI